MSTKVKGMWTKAELAEARQLAEACEANSARWAFADWLLTKEPLSGGRGHHTGTFARIETLADEVGLSGVTLRAMRVTAYSWPPEYRVPNASFSAHQRYKTGGAAKAAERRAHLAANPRDYFGKVLTPGRRSAPTITCGVETYLAVVAEANATGQSIAATTRELIQEALDARVWLASEAAA